jgi:hypothetical protein
MAPDRIILLAACVAFIVAGSPAVAISQTTDTLSTLRSRVLDADTSDTAAAAYKGYFVRLGREGLRDRVKDEDIGIALQAAWEVHKKPLKRPQEVVGRVADAYDRDELTKFLAILKDRTKAPVPEWWAASVVDVDLFSGRHHAFGSDRQGGPKLRELTGGAAVPEGANLDETGDTIVYSVGKRAVRFPKTTFGKMAWPTYTALVGEKSAVVAAYSPASGFAFKLAGFTGEGGKAAWTADVWAAGRTLLAGMGFHCVELREKTGVVFVFGAESHGMYLEAFDTRTGKCQFRFCTCYWFNHSEEWGLK